MNRKRIALIGVGAMLMASSAMAAPYGMAGCGIGALVLKDQPGKIQILAATLNNIIVPQTSAITSGTSNCYEDDSREQASLFITVNKVALANDIARGNGETVTSLARILKCDDPTAFGLTLQHNYKAIFPSSSTPATAVDKAIESTVRQSKNLAKSCKVYS